ncbi:hypothetical protein [Planococcus halotolerans]|uniref:Uncharacterized protein n=1 Tax=Planococcus halotolerans TaxID=2233542 RepID=A0A365KXN4_9BACL|nr:hypothetical protein [Planococcus halotolerans]QHJ72080.1 hypothetical protein DNR44_016400 [Planococcus halotolerans]RAZ77904.1 hypothetical protein DP120_10530 [Planococcus halotolerans]
MTSKNNVIAMTLQIVGGTLIAVYAFRALALIGEFGGGAAFDVFLQGVIFGMLLIGFGEVIKLMQGLFNQREPERPVEDVEKERRAVLRQAEEHNVPLETRNRIMDFYTKKNMIVDDIEPAPYEGYVIVHHDGQRDIVDLNNWEVEILTEGQLNRNPELKSLLE